MISQIALFLMDHHQKILNGASLKLTGGIHCKLHDIY